MNYTVIGTMLFAVMCGAEADVRVDLDCPGAKEMTYNQATQVLTCGRITVKMAACAPTEVRGLETDNAVVVCSKPGNWEFYCPGGMSKISDGPPVLFSCKDTPLSAPSGVRIQLQDSTK